MAVATSFDDSTAYDDLGSFVLFGRNGLVASAKSNTFHSTSLAAALTTGTSTSLLSIHISICKVIAWLLAELSISIHKVLIGDGVNVCDLCLGGVFCGTIPQMEPVKLLTLEALF